MRLPLEFVGSSEGWGVAKPSREFFQRIIQASGVHAHRIAYVGDRVDNDIVPASAAGMYPILVRRGLWAESPAATRYLRPSISSLVELLPLVAPPTA
jgi:FMN phosphatase YigB (HAD superfamily)